MSSYNKSAIKITKEPNNEKRSPYRQSRILSPLLDADFWIINFFMNFEIDKNVIVNIIW